MNGRGSGPLPSRTELRAMALAARHRLRAADRSVGRRRAEPDPQLLDRIAEPFRSVADAHDRLRAAEAHLRERGDRRAVFLTVYALMTGRVRAGLEAGDFEDAQWVRSYLVDFANRYRVALVAFERGAIAELPAPWVIGFRASTAGVTLLLQDALLGINAHINYDLPYTLRDVGLDPNRPAKRRDHRRINGVLQRLIDVVQRSLADGYDAAGYAALDRLAGELDEQLTILGLREARDLAWRNAARLVDTRSGLVRWLVRLRIRLVATGAAAFVLAPSGDPAVLEALREVERHGPGLDGLLESVEAKAGAASIPIDPDT